MIEIHILFESLGYFVGARLYWKYAKYIPQPPIIDRWVLITAAIFGAWLGAKALHIAQHWPHYASFDALSLFQQSGKSVLGAFLGGTLLVEWAKRCIGWRIRTGDIWVAPLMYGVIIGRIGCQLSGLWDQTYGIPTHLPWAWDYGDGIGRHPTAAYEIVLLVLLAIFLSKRTYPVNGMRFNIFMGSYCAIRFILEFLKPPFGPDGGTLAIQTHWNLTMIQWAALIGLIYFVCQFYWLKHRPNQQLNSPKQPVHG